MMRNVRLFLAGFFSLVIVLSLIAAEHNQQFAANKNVVLDEPKRTPATDSSSGAPKTTQHYVLEPSQSKFTAHALAGGLLWFKGHDHLIAIPDFSGEAMLTPETINPASLKITAKAGSMVETSSVFTEQQKQIINKELREIVLLPDKYPDMVFQSSSVTGKATGANDYELQITGPLTLHGTTKTITIPTKVTTTSNQLRASGEFSFSRDDFNVKATSAVHGLIQVKDRVKFIFDIVGHQR